MLYRIEAVVAGRLVLFMGAETEVKALRTAMLLQLQHRARPGREIVVRRDGELIARWVAGDESWVATASVVAA
jgi:hypothetical protein